MLGAFCLRKYSKRSSTGTLARASIMSVSVISSTQSLVDTMSSVILSRIDGQRECVLTVVPGVLFGNRQDALSIRIELQVAMAVL